LSFSGYGNPANWARSTLLLDGKRARATCRQWLKDGWKAHPGLREEFEGEVGGRGDPERWGKVKELLVTDADAQDWKPANGK
jgi:hypothetical protein